MNAPSFQTLLAARRYLLETHSADVKLLKRLDAAILAAIENLLGELE